MACNGTGESTVDLSSQHWDGESDDDGGGGGGRGLKLSVRPASTEL